ncbi:DUF2474 domain-containing protein [Plastoroseomonas hellenica]|uniref:DUF2474 domain-containing protein n=1 Tax=Plastoroseomonas hellenica TaxID=2687306 RepID=A0ABS5F621_9PROT|nr:DUF2474 domain-containing protein [Plastoroseomonas hellenica]MBR0646509.1 DUF2474 domain-containing protein [Plastoroseomonas hellenica]MBR0668015.1 DUF2474 domain-containing protein [Plastoroseomonas hellenica]
MTVPEALKPRRLRQLGWLVAIWAASVVALAIVALLFRAIMGMAGLTLG